MFRSARLRAQSGISLIETLVVVVVVVIAMLALYGLVDASNKITKQETEVADVQQSARIGVSQLSRIIRQSGVGGLYYANAVLPITNNSAGGTSLTDISGAAHFIRKGTDVIAVRGVLSADRYALSPSDVVCSGGCDTTTTMTITIRSTTVRGFVNFAASATPLLANKTRPFYFAVVDETNQNVTVGGSTWVVPYYTVGLVTANTSGTWYTLDTTTTPANPTFTFTMNPADAGARKFNATTSLSPSLTLPVRCGAVDEVRFFVDEGAVDASALTVDTHPSLAQATLDPSTGHYDVETLVEDVEDFQIAYGVDGADGTTPDGGVSPRAVDTSGENKDEWVGNFAGEVTDTLPISTANASHSGVDAFINTSAPVGKFAVPALHSVWISLVVKSTDPDFVFDGPGARGIKILDSTAVSFSTATGRPYRRRPLSLAVSLRNYNS
jgi:Tfp pilus assembly protein PilV